MAGGILVSSSGKLLVINQNLHSKRPHFSSYESQILFPWCCDGANTIREYALSRRQFHLPRRTGSHTRTFVNYLFLSACMQSAYMQTFTEALEQEVELSLKKCKEPDKTPAFRPKFNNENEYQNFLIRTLNTARGATVRESERTAGFRLAREPEWKYGEMFGGRALTSDVNRIVWPRLWYEYRRVCQLRHTWGVFLRSNMEWDWNPSKSLHALFSIDSGPHTGE